MPTTPLTETERVDARRHMGYPMYGEGSAGYQNWRFFQSYGLMEFRLSNMSDPEAAQTRTYLTALNGLETAILGSADNFDTLEAAVWTGNPNEMRSRERLYASWRQKLCDFFGIEPGPYFVGMSNTIALTV